MELILINESKLKIMLTADDMEDYSISNENMSYENTDTRKMFGKILEKAKEKTGFDSSLGKLFIQVYPSKNGGCEVYVTTERVGAQNKKSDRKGTPPKKKKEYCVYVFSDFSSVLCACSLLHICKYEYESSLYCEGLSLSKKYYLVLQEEVMLNGQYNKKRPPSKSDLASEYGKKLDGKNMLMYINEHAEELVATNAVSALANLK